MRKIQRPASAIFECKIKSSSSIGILKKLLADDIPAIPRGIESSFSY